jgi:membrane protease YdiL (CAAX protease family)
LFAIGEELGWRGFLQGALTDKLGITQGIVVLGLIWSFWHLPVLLAGYNYPATPVLGAFVLFPVTLVAASFFLGWLTIRSGSVWPAVLAHGATNSIEEGVIANVHLATPQLYGDVLRLALTVVVGLISWALLARSGSRSDDPHSV